MTLDEIKQPERQFSQWNLQGIDGAPAILFESIGSTNKWLKEHVNECKPGTLVLADHQDGGRGRYDRVWRSPAGRNLYLSFLLQPEQIPVADWPHLTQVAAITLAHLYADLGVQVHVKWPNDLLWNKHKMCGLLAERVQHNGKPALVLGIGININSTPEDFAGLDRLAASLAIALGHDLNREEFLRLYIHKLSKAFSHFASHGIAPWLSEWRSMLNFVGSQARVVLFDKTLQGTVLGINDDGSLLFKPDGEACMTVYSGDLEV